MKHIKEFSEFLNESKEWMELEDKLDAKLSKLGLYLYETEPDSEDELEDWLNDYKFVIELGPGEDAYEVYGLTNSKSVYDKALKILKKNGWKP